MSFKDRWARNIRRRALIFTYIPRLIKQSFTKRIVVISTKEIFSEFGHFNSFPYGQLMLPLRYQVCTRAEQSPSIFSKASTHSGPNKQPSMSIDMTNIFILLPFNCAGGFGCDVQNNTVNTSYFTDNSAGYFF